MDIYFTGGGIKLVNIAKKGKKLDKIETSILNCTWPSFELANTISPLFFNTISLNQKTVISQFFWTRENKGKVKSTTEFYKHYKFYAGIAISNKLNVIATTDSGVPLLINLIKSTVKLTDA